eukprot:CAMPEP_0114493652 /NCGR_PEP_ID=MMETSP0109-20121206/4221_1 /TAXON_ID=29199 /ORGANISM="Chlorarachnion reptans, Strain CCCM449" /LENGTH=486 /DNA_ID=CAMNT_0001670613 /DNA_START=242 /DNA_END=1703 /DNA_ORIENTATION=+
MCSPSTMLIGKRQWARLLDVLHLKLTRVRRPAVYGISESLSPSELQNPTVPPSTTRYGSLSLKTNSDQDEDVAASNSREASETEIEPFSVRADHTIENTIRHQFKWRKRASTLSPSQSFRTSRHNLGAVRQRASWVIWLSRYRSEAKYSLEILYKLAVYTNTFALCYYEAGDGKFDRFINVTSAVCVSIFLLELLQEAMGRGIFHHLAAKPVDAVVSLTALPIEILFWGRWLAILRAFRVLRIVTTSKKLTKLIRGIFGAMQTVLWLMVVVTMAWMNDNNKLRWRANTPIWKVLLLVIFYIFVVIGMQTFSYRAVGKSPYQKIESFDGFWPAMLSLFQITTTNNWNDVMFTVLPDTRLQYSLFFISFYFIVCMVILNVVTTLIIQGFSKNQEFVEQESWMIQTRDGIFKITRVEPWSYQTVESSQSALRDRELLEGVKELLADAKSSQAYSTNLEAVPELDSESETDLNPKKSRRFTDANVPRVSS